jgi:uncharacterized protein YggE
MIQVNGSGTASVAPNNAVVVVGVRTEAETASEALTQNNEQVNELIPVLLDAGIASEDIQTQQISLMPRYSNQPVDDGQPEITGYIAINTVRVRIRDISQVGDILDTAVQNGGNLIESISFEVSQQDLALQQAREAAFDNARQKAEQLADLAGVQLGNLISIVEVSGSFPRPYGTGGAAEDMAQLAVPVEPGSQIIQVDLQVAWAITGGTAGGARTATPFVPTTGNTRTPTVITGVTITPIAATATSVANTATATVGATTEVPTVGVTVIATNEPTVTETSTGP